ncbi:MAG: hypothetical protein GPOALKHO_001259 [Sodalis sp.]|nr:MAG: hypothetical protein GPOALKHO_001259 [Sodalis sp.]
MALAIYTSGLIGIQAPSIELGVARLHLAARKYRAAMQQIPSVRLKPYEFSWRTVAGRRGGVYSAVPAAHGAAGDGRLSRCRLTVKTSRCCRAAPGIPRQLSIACVVLCRATAL